MTLLVALLGTDVLGSFLMLAGEAKISFDIYTIAKQLTIPGWIVIIILLIQSVYMIAVGIERWLTYNKAKQQSRQPQDGQPRFENLFHYDSFQEMLRGDILCACMPPL